MTIYSHQSYLQKHRALPRQIHLRPVSDLGLVVVIPCHHEPDLLRTLDSLEACEPPRVAVEVIIVINAGSNHPATVHQMNADAQTAFTAWKQTPRRYRYHLIVAHELRPKHAGVGMARKIGLDEAVDRLEQAETKTGLLVNLDADCTVAPNYLQAIEQWFARHPNMEAASLAFEHPLAGHTFEPAVYAGILRYELYLRYYVQGLRWAGFPLAYHCIGSAMAVRASAYQAQNGMNRRKAGEDYYFLQKFMQLGTLGDLTETTVYPSSRPSDKVPFGTGRAIRAWLQGTYSMYEAFDLRSFAELRQLVEAVPTLYSGEPPELGSVMKAYLQRLKVAEVLPELRAHSASEAGFVKRFWAWFDGLKALQFMHFAREGSYPDQPLPASAAELYQRITETDIVAGWEPLLIAYRQLERNSPAMGKSEHRG